MGRMAKLVAFITLLHLFGNASCTVQLLIPSLEHLGHGAITLKWSGFQTWISMGKYFTRNNSDDGILLKLKLPTGGRAALTINHELGAGGTEIYLLAGAETGLRAGVAFGIGCELGILKFRKGLVAMTTTGITKIRVFARGLYAGRLLTLSNRFLQQLDADKWIVQGNLRSTTVIVG